MFIIGTAITEELTSQDSYSLSFVDVLTHSEWIVFGCVSPLPRVRTTLGTLDGRGVTHNVLYGSDSWAAMHCLTGRVYVLTTSVSMSVGQQDKSNICTTQLVAAEFVEVFCTECFMYLC